MWNLKNRSAESVNQPCNFLLRPPSYWQFVILAKHFLGCKDYFWSAIKNLESPENRWPQLHYLPNCRHVKPIVTRFPMDRVVFVEFFELIQCFRYCEAWQA